MAEGTSILETSPLVLAGCMVFILGVTLFAEWLLHTLHHKLSKENRKGMLAALDAMKDELMLLGLAGLVLLSIGGTISRWCGESIARTPLGCDDAHPAFPPLDPTAPDMLLCPAHPCSQIGEHPTSGAEVLDRLRRHLLLLPGEDRRSD
jgi:hypothetical protein